jgi:uncharacterized protein
MNECMRCGACCFSESPRHARVTGDDHERLGDDAERLVVFLGNQAFMRIHEGRCAALVVDPSGAFFCSVYDRRPCVCRELERGSPACLGELANKSERPKKALRDLVRLRAKRVSARP